jgi:hypothetical protein
MNYNHYLGDLLIAAILCLSYVSAKSQNFIVKVDTRQEPIHAGKYTEELQSLTDYQCPKWFRDAKLRCQIRYLGALGPPVSG